MKVSASTLALVAAATAAPAWVDAQCELSDSIAEGLVDGFGELLTSFTEEAALNILAAEFTDTSSSINFLSGQPLDGVTFPARQAFIQGQGQQPPIGFEVLGIDAVTCAKDATDAGIIAFRWKATIGANQTGGAKGINILYVSKGTEEGQEGVDGWVIDDVYSEFNSAVWAIEFGGTCEAPSGPPALKRS